LWVTTRLRGGFYAAIFTSSRFLRVIKEAGGNSARRFFGLEITGGIIDWGSNRANPKE